MSSGTNLFEFAPRELSQSAFWAWVVQSAEPGEKGLADVAPVGRQLLRRVGAPVPREGIEVSTERSLQGDAGRVDIHVQIDGRAKLLIEHKVSGALQPGQLKRYRASVDDSVHCLFLSTSYKLQKRRTEDGFKGFGDWRVLDAKRLLNILESGASSHPLVEDYRDWLANRVEGWYRLEEKALSQESSDRKKALGTIPGQWRFMERVTESFSAEGRQYGRPARTSGEPWTQFRFVEEAGDQDTLFYRIDRLAKGPVFRLIQYQSQPTPSWAEKKRRREELQRLWRQCCDEGGMLDWMGPKNRGKKSSSVARINLLGCNASDLENELRTLHTRFVERVEEMFGWTVGRHKYSYDCLECEGEFHVEQEISEYGSQVFPPDRCSTCAAEQEPR